MLALAALIIVAQGTAIATPSGSGPPAAPITHAVAGNLSSLQCPTASVCFAINQTHSNHWAITTLTKHGAKAHTVALAKSITPIALSCPTKSGCALLAHNTTSNAAELLTINAHGTPGKPRSSGTRAGTLLSVIACHASITRCTLTGAFDGSLYVVTVHGSKSTTHHLKLPKTVLAASIQAVACPSTAVCEAVGFETLSSGNRGVAVAIHGGVGAKPSVIASANGGGMFGVACPVVHTCYATGSGKVNDSVYTLTNGTLTHTAAAPAMTLLYGIACQTSRSCDAVGSNAAQLPHQGVILPIHGGTPAAAQLTSITPSYGSPEFGGSPVSAYRTGIVAVGLSPTKVFGSVVSAS
jgi:hypothetical protein